jgi:DNA-binding CsgD family transcriptional regulator
MLSTPEDNRLAGRAELSRLSETERRIVSLVAVGRTTNEVGERLFLSPQTVEWSLARIYRKLGVASRSELAAVLAAAMQDEPRRETPPTGSSQIDDMEGT